MNFRLLYPISTLALALTVLSAGAAQADPTSATATNTGKARLIRPINITSNADLDFGLLAKGTLAGPVDVTLDPLVGQVPSITSSNPSAVKPLRGHADANFAVMGEAGEVVQVTYPASITLKKGAGGTSETEMTVSNLIVDVWHSSNQDLDLLNNGTFTMPADHTAWLEVGGTLTVEPGDQLGAYSGTFNVTVSYL